MLYVYGSECGQRLRSQLKVTRGRISTTPSTGDVF